MAVTNRLIGVFGIAIIALVPTISAEKRLAERDSLVASVAEGLDLPQPIQYSGGNVKASPVLDGRSLVESWLRPRELVCNDPGWAVCPCNAREISRYQDLH